MSGGCGWRRFGPVLAAFAAVVLLWTLVASTRTDAQAGGTQVSADVTQSTTWTAAGSPYTLTRNISVAAGATLTIDPGVTVQALQYGGLDVRGTLIANGTAGAPILFTATTRTPGWWYGVSFTGTDTAPLTGSSLSYVTIEWGGYTYADLYLEYATVSISNGTFRNSAKDGVYGWYGGVPNIATATFTANAEYAVRLHDGSVNPILSGLSAVGNGTDGFAFEAGTRVGSHTWFNMGISYYLLGIQTVAPGATLTIQPGVSIRAGQYSGLEVRGKLTAEGDASNWIVFNGTQPTPGWWSGLSFIGTQGAPLQGSSLRYVQVIYGGYTYADVYLEYANVAMSHVALLSSGKDGIYAWYGGSASTISQSQLFGNAGFAIQSQDTTVPMVATNNWFGDPSGPNHASNPSGTGNKVGDGVTFNPWLRSPPDPLVIPSSAVIGSSGGGLDAGALDLQVPAGAVGSSTTFQAWPRSLPPPSSGLRPISAFTLVANGGTVTTFGQNITIVVQYDPSLIAPGSEGSLAVYALRDTGPEKLSCTLDTAAHVLRCQTNHFTDFEIAGLDLATPTPRAGGVPVPTPCPGCKRLDLPLAVRNTGP